MNIVKDDVSIAYILQVHRGPGQINKFIRQLAADRHSDIYIHIDRKSMRAISHEIMSGGNIEIIKDNVEVIWGDISQVDATLSLLKSQKKSRKKYDFVCFRSGQDLLVRNGLHNHLKRNKGKIFMNAKKIENSASESYFWKVQWPKFTRHRYDSIFHPYRILRPALIGLYNLGVNIIPNRNRLPMNVYRGSSWFCIPFEVAEYIIDYLEKNPWYYEAFRNALAPDEYFFQTIIMNSPYASGIVCDNLTYLNFGKSYSDNNHPVTLKMKDLPEIEASGKFFARKFDESVDKEIIEYFYRKCSTEAEESDSAARPGYVPRSAVLT